MKKHWMVVIVLTALSYGGGNATAMQVEPEDLPGLYEDWNSCDMRLPLISKGEIEQIEQTETQNPGQLAETLRELSQQESETDPDAMRASVSVACLVLVDPGFFHPNRGSNLLYGNASLKCDAARFVLHHARRFAERGELDRAAQEGFTPTLVSQAVLSAMFDDTSDENLARTAADTMLNYPRLLARTETTVGWKDLCTAAKIINNGGWIKGAPRYTYFLP